MQNQEMIIARTSTNLIRTDRSVDDIKPWWKRDDDLPDSKNSIIYLKLTLHFQSMHECSYRNYTDQTGNS